MTRILLYKEHYLPSGDLMFAESLHKDNRPDTNPEPLLAIALLSPGGNHRLGKIKKCSNRVADCYFCCRSQNAVGPWQPPSGPGPPLLQLCEKELSADADLGSSNRLRVCERAGRAAGTTDPAAGVCEQVRGGEGCVHVRLELRRGWWAAPWHLH